MILKKENIEYKEVRDYQVDSERLYINYEDRFECLRTSDGGLVFQFDFRFYSFFIVNDFLLGQIDSREDILVYDLVNQVERYIKGNFILHKNVLFEDKLLISCRDNKSDHIKQRWCLLDIETLRLQAFDHLTIPIITLVHKEIGVSTILQRIRATNIWTDKILWEYTTTDAFGVPLEKSFRPKRSFLKPFRYKDHLLLPGNNKGIFALDIKTGKELWCDREICWYSVKLSEDELFIFAKDGSLIVLNVEDGTEKRLILNWLDNPNYENLKGVSLESSRIDFYRNYFQVYTFKHSELFVLSKVDASVLGHLKVGLPKTSVIGSVNIVNDIVYFTTRIDGEKGKRIYCYRMESKI